MYQCLLPHSKCPNVCNKTRNREGWCFWNNAHMGRCDLVSSGLVPLLESGEATGCAHWWGEERHRATSVTEWTGLQATACFLRNTKMNQQYISPCFRRMLPEVHLVLNLMFSCSSWRRPVFQSFVILLRWHICLTFSIISLLLKTQSFGSFLCYHQQGKERN